MLDLDPLALAKASKKLLRERMQQLRQALPAAGRQRRDLAISEAVTSLDEFIAARHIASFAPMLERGEIDVRRIDEVARRTGKSVSYPFMDPEPDGWSTGFRVVTAVSQLAKRGQKFLEPERSAPVAHRGDLGLVLVPALAAAADGHRLGLGAGFYDSTLPEVVPPAITVVLVYDFQLLAGLPTEPHDVPCDIVVTDRRVLRRTALSPQA